MKKGKMHDCCQGLDALWLIVKRFSSGMQFDAVGIMLAKTQCCTAHQLHTFRCYVLIQVWVYAHICSCIEAALMT